MISVQQISCLLLLTSLLSACGHDPGERALTGAGIGAAGGAVGGALLGAPITGAVVGGAAGAATGAFTRPDQINLDH
jgi:hypothetical protein